MISAADLVQEHIKLDDWIAAETKRFTDHVASVKKRMEEIKSILLGLLNEQKQNSASTDHGTYYISTIMTPKVTDRDAYLKFIGDNWNTFGGDMLQISAPQKDALKNYMEENKDAVPPGVEVSYFNRLNIRRS